MSAFRWTGFFPLLAILLLQGGCSTESGNPATGDNLEPKPDVAVNGAEGVLFSDRLQLTVCQKYADCFGDEVRAYCNEELPSVAMSSATGLTGSYTLEDLGSLEENSTITANASLISNCLSEISSASCSTSGLINYDQVNAPRDFSGASAFVGYVSCHIWEE